MPVEAQFPPPPLRPSLRRAGLVGIRRVGGHPELLGLVPQPDEVGRTLGESSHDLPVHLRLEVGGHDVRAGEVRSVCEDGGGPIVRREVYEEEPLLLLRPTSQEPLQHSVLPGQGVRVRLDGTVRRRRNRNGQREPEADHRAHHRGRVESGMPTGHVVEQSRQENGADREGPAVETRRRRAIPGRRCPGRRNARQ